MRAGGYGCCTRMIRHAAQISRLACRHEKKTPPAASFGRVGTRIGRAARGVLEAAQRRWETSAAVPALAVGFKIVRVSVTAAIYELHAIALHGVERVTLEIGATGTSPDR
jgi:hypothetical protein